MAVTLSQSYRKWKRYKYFVTNWTMGKHIHQCSPRLVAFIDYVIDPVSILWTKRFFLLFPQIPKITFFLLRGFSCYLLLILFLYVFFPVSGSSLVRLHATRAWRTRVQARRRHHRDGPFRPTLVDWRDRCPPWPLPCHLCRSLSHLTIIDEEEKREPVEKKSLIYYVGAFVSL